MNLRQIRYLCEVVDAGSAAAAAARLHVAPTAISMQLAQLESELGGALFDRSRRPMDLTSLGRFFHPRAKVILADAKRLEDETRAIAAGHRGVLAIGHTRSAIFTILPRAIRAFSASHPNVKVELMTLLSEHQYEHLASGRIQLGISRYLGPVDSVEGLSFRPLLDDPFVVALPRAHPLAKRKAVRASELDADVLITYPKDPQSRFAEQTLAALRRAGGESNVGHEANDIHTALGMVASGLGYCLVGRSVCGGNRDDIAFVRISDLRDTAKVVAVTRQADTSKITASFIETLVATVGTG